MIDLLIGLGCIGAQLMPRPMSGQLSIKSRPMEVNDLFRERVIDAVPSPDGSLIAIVVRRAATSSERYQQGVLTEGRADIWLARPDGTGRRNLTNGAHDTTGHWMPSWSPDGSRLAMLSTRGGNGVVVYVWHRQHDSLTQVLTEGIDLIASADPSGGNWNRHPFAWVSANRLAVMMLPPARRSWFETMLVAGTHGAMAAWPKAERGVEPTVSVLESPPGMTIPVRSGKLVLVDVDTRKTTALADVPMEENSSGLRSFLLGPERRFAVVLTSERRPFDPTQHRLTRSQARHRIALVSLEPTHRSVRWVDSVSAVVSQTFEHVIRWAPRDSAVMILAKRVSSLDGPSRLYTISLTDAAVRQLMPDDWDTSTSRVSAFGVPLEGAGAIWTNDGRRIIYARPPAVSGVPSTSAARFDWWLLDGTTRPRNLTASLLEAPRTVSRVTDPHVIAGLAGGKLWAIDIETAATEVVAPRLPPIRAIKWPCRRDMAAAMADQLVVDVGTSLKPDLQTITVGTNAPAEEVSLPSWGGTLISYVPQQALAVFTDSVDRVAATHQGRVSDLAELNASLSRIELPAQRLITYRGVDGDSLRAVVVLPNGYVAGKRYPMITHVYAGTTFRDTVLLRDVDPKVQLLAAHGYVVLLPSIPLKPTNVSSDPYHDIPKGVMPAVDRAIDLGIADPGRLGVMGFSYGGYTTYTLITSTTRFRAAVAEQGPVDLVSGYGAFRATDRYGDQPHVTLANPKLIEDGQLRMRASPWGDLWRYLKNSPLYYLDRVETPLLIIASDQDIISMEQPEGVFTGLQRLGKRVQLARYWGEWHVFDSPANIRDAWHRITAWFDCYLGGPIPSAKSQ